MKWDLGNLKMAGRQRWNFGGLGTRDVWDFGFGRFRNFGFGKMAARQEGSRGNLAS